MKKHYLLIPAIITFGCVSAQITVTSNNTAIVGESFNFIVQSSPTISPIQSGANQTWDFTTVTGTSSAFNYINLASSVEPSTYPLANVVESASGAENYYFDSNSEHSLEGQLIPNVIRVIYTDKREFIKYPISYNDVFNETFSGTAENISAAFTTNRGGTIEIKADAYGTINLPYGSLGNTLRVRAVFNYSDVYQGSTIGTYSDTIYSWYNAATGNFIATYSVGYSNGSLYLSQATYIEQNDLVTGFNDFIAKEDLISIYPNPANDFIKINTTLENISMSIYDISGKLVQSSGSGIFDNSLVDISDLIKGIYIVKFTNDFNNYSTTLIIE